MQNKKPEDLINNYEHAYQNACDDLLMWINSNVSSDESFMKSFKAQISDWQTEISPRTEKLANGAKIMFIPRHKLSFSKQNKQQRKYKLLPTTQNIALLVDKDKKLFYYKLSQYKAPNSGKKAHKFLQFMKQLHQDDGTNIHQIIKRYHFGSISPEMGLKKYQDCFSPKSAPRKIARKNLEKLARKHKITLSEQQLDVFDKKIKSIQGLNLKKSSLELLSWLNQEALSTAISTKNRNTKSYNWLGQGQSEYRIGAVQSYPAIIPHYYQGELSEKFTTAIDSGTSISTSLTQIFGEQIDQRLNKKTYKPLHSKTKFQLGDEGFKAIKDNADILSAIKKEDYPKTKTDWKNFNKSCELLRSFCDGVGYNPIQFVQITDSPQSFIKKHDLIPRKISDISDFSEQIYTMLVLPIMAQEAKKYDLPISKTIEDNRCIYLNNRNRKHKSIKLLNSAMSTMNPNQLVKASDNWHKRANTFFTQTQSMSVTKDINWEAITNIVTAPNGVIFTPLTNKEELKQEGENMDHCVGGYSSACANRNSHIIHLEITDKNGIKRTSTLQLNDDIEKEAVYIVQNNAEHNNKPTKELLEAAKWYEASINDGKLAVNWKKIQIKRQKNQMELQKNMLENTIGFNPFEKDKCDEAFDIIKRFIPGTMQKMTREIWIDKTNIIQAIHHVLGIEHKLNKTGQNNERTSTKTRGTQPYRR